MMLIRYAIPLLCLLSSSAFAQTSDQVLDMSAIANVFYEKTKDECFYEPEIADYLQQVKDQYSWYSWSFAEDDAKTTFTKLLNMSRLTGNINICQASGKAISLGIAVNMLSILPSPKVRAAMMRLEKGDVWRGIQK